MFTVLKTNVQLYFLQSLYLGNGFIIDLIWKEEPLLCFFVAVFFHFHCLKNIWKKTKKQNKENVLWEYMWCKELKFSIHSTWIVNIKDVIRISEAFISEIIEDLQEILT